MASGNPALECFVISPIGEVGTHTRQRADTLLNEIIRPAAAEVGFDVTRADEIAEPGRISRQILARLIGADVVVADLTDQNPNVFYELAIRHATERATIHLYEDASEIPFDVQDVRSVRVGDHVTIAREAQRVLTDMLAHVRENPGESMPTPFTQGLGLAVTLEAAEQQGTIEVVRALEDVRDEVRDLRRKVSEIELVSDTSSEQRATPAQIEIGAVESAPPATNIGVRVRVRTSRDRGVPSLPVVLIVTPPATFARSNSSTVVAQTGSRGITPAETVLLPHEEGAISITAAAGGITTVHIVEVQANEPEPVPSE